MMSGYEYDGRCGTRVSEALGKFDAATLAKLDVDDEADGFTRRRSPQKLFGTCIEFRVIPERRQQTAGGAADAVIILDYSNNFRQCRHD
jgi:hypothetical protein